MGLSASRMLVNPFFLWGLEQKDFCEELALKMIGVLTKPTLGVRVSLWSKNL